MKINNKEIGTGRTYVIADVGSNFNGSLELAKEYIDAGKEIGVDAIKFQSYKAKSLLSPFGLDGKKSLSYDIVRKYELPDAWHGELFEHAEKVGVEFFTTPFNLDILDELNRIGVRVIKIASGDLTFVPLLEKVASYGKPVILSSGMSDVGEIKGAVELLSRNGVNDIAVLHCVATYPPEYKVINLKCINTMIDLFRRPVGLSDHTPDDVTALGAVSQGACIIEKHITMSKDLGTPDAPFAMTINEFGDMVKKIRILELALGKEEKVPAETELPERVFARRGIYAKCDIDIGDKLSLENVKFVRPVNGAGASEWRLYDNKLVTRAIKKDKPIDESCI